VALSANVLSVDHFSQASQVHEANAKTLNQKYLVRRTAAKKPPVSIGPILPAKKDCTICTGIEFHCHGVIGDG
jgi:hypothetical protein